jgi:hypothetical protein
VSEKHSCGPITFRSTPLTHTFVSVSLCLCLSLSLCLSISLPISSLWPGIRSSAPVGWDSVSPLVSFTPTSMSKVAVGKVVPCIDLILPLCCSTLLTPPRAHHHLSSARHQVCTLFSLAHSSCSLSLSVSFASVSVSHPTGVSSVLGTGWKKIKGKDFDAPTSGN